MIQLDVLLANLSLIGESVATDALYSTAAKDTAAFPIHLLDCFGGCVTLELSSYLSRLARYIPQFDEISDVALMLLLRISRKLQSALPVNHQLDFAPLSASKIHRLCLCSVLIAIKLHCDELRTNAFYAHVGGVSLRQLNMMERAFLELLEFDVHVSAREYQQTLHLLMRDVANVAQRDVIATLLLSSTPPCHDQQSPIEAALCPSPYDLEQQSLAAESSSQISTSCSSRIDELADAVPEIGVKLLY
jgi:hypothetical protein